MIAVLLILIIFGLLGGGLIAFLTLSHLRHERERIRNTTTLLIAVPKDIPRKDDEMLGNQPKDFREAIAPTEQFFSSLASIHNEGLLSDWVRRQIQISFEIVNQGNQISFYIAAGNDLIPFLEKQLYSFFPNLSITRMSGYNLFEGVDGEVVATSLSFTKRFIFPIRTFKTLEADPLNSLTGALSRLGERSNAAIQIIIEPMSERWREAPAMAAQHVLEGKHAYIHSSPVSRLVYGFVDLVSSGLVSSNKSKGGQQLSSDNKTWRTSPVKDDLMKAFNEKSSKAGFRSTIRIIATGQDRQSAKMNLNSIVDAFAQFATPAWNGFRSKSVVKNGQIVADFITRYHSNTAHSKFRPLILNSEELASIFHLPNRYTDTPNIRWLLSRSLAPPVNLPSQGIIVGESVYRGDKVSVRITDDDRRRHIFMIGKTGVGKTTLFENMIDQDIANGKGVCFVDPLGDAVESILQKIPANRFKDVILFDPSDTDRPIGFNLLDWKHPEEKDFLIAEWIEIFYKLYDPNRTGIIGPQWEHWGRNAALTIMSLPDGGTLIDIPRLFTDDKFREKAISYVQDPVVKAFWDQQLAKTADFHKSEMYNYFISKFGRFMTNALMRNIIGQTKSGFNIREIMDSGKILLVNLAKGKIGEMNSNLLGLILVSKIQAAAFSRAEMPENERTDFYLYVDEFQNFTTDSFATILSEARKYRLNLNITNQFIAQLTDKIRDAVIGNAGTMIVYRVGAADAEFMVKEFQGVTIDDMANLERFTTYVKLLVDLTPTKPFSMKGILSPIKKDPNIANQVKELSRLSWGKDKSVIEDEVLNRTKIDQIEIPPDPSAPVTRV